MNLVFDIGGTSMRLSLANDSELTGELLTTPTPQDYQQAVETFKHQAQTLLKGEAVTAAAGGIAGPLNKDKSMLVSAPNLTDWVDRPLQADLSAALGVEVKLENDTALGALGEANWGAGRFYKIMAYLAVGTGVGGCRIVDKHIDANSLGFEPGHQIISQHAHIVTSLEDLVSGKSIQKQHDWQPGDTALPEGLQSELAWNLAVGIHNLVLMWSPDAVVLGGGVMISGAIPLDKVESNLRSLMQTFPSLPPILMSHLAQKSGLLGALSLIQQS